MNSMIENSEMSLTSFWNEYQLETSKKLAPFVVSGKQDQNYRTLFVDQLLPGDFCIRVNDTNFFVHKGFFLKKSGNFQSQESFNLLSGAKEEVKEGIVFDDVPVEFELAMQEVIKFVYGTNFSIDSKTLVPALVIVNFLWIKELEDELLKFSSSPDYAFFVLSVCVDLEKNVSKFNIYQKREEFEKTISENFDDCARGSSHLCCDNVEVMSSLFEEEKLVVEKSKNLQSKLSEWAILYADALQGKKDDGSTFLDDFLKVLKISHENVITFYSGGVSTNNEELKTKCIEVITKEINLVFHEDLLKLQPKDMFAVASGVFEFVKASSLFELVHEYFPCEMKKKESFTTLPLFQNGTPISNTNPQLFNEKQSNDIGSFVEPSEECWKQKIWNLIKFDKITKENLNSFVLRRDASLDMVTFACLRFGVRPPPKEIPGNLKKFKVQVFKYGKNGKNCSERKNLDILNKMFCFDVVGDKYVNFCDGVYFRGGGVPFIEKYEIKSPNTKYYLKSWKLYGYISRKRILLSKVQNDTHLKPQSSYVFKIGANHRYKMFTHFKLVQTGKNHGGDSDFGIAGFRFFQTKQCIIPKRKH